MMTLIAFVQILNKDVSWGVFFVFVLIIIALIGGLYTLIYSVLKDIIDEIQRKKKNKRDRR